MIFCYPRSLHHALKEFDSLGAIFQRYDSFFPIRLIAAMHALATELAGDVHGVYLFDLYAEQFFHRFGDLDLIGISPPY